MSSAQTLVYTHTVSALPKYIEEVGILYNSLGILNTNIRPKLRDEIDVVMKNDIEWIKFMKYPNVSVTAYLEARFLRMKAWLTEWKAFESNNAGANNHLVSGFEECLREIKIAILALILFRDTNQIDEFHNLANSTYHAYPNAPFEILVLQAKKDYFKSNIWKRGEPSMKWTDLIQHMRNDLALYTKNGINIIYQQEMKKHSNVQGIDISFGALDNFFLYIWGSIAYFRRFINRNYLYGMIEQGLQDNFTTYEDLQRDRNSTIESIRLVITKCSFPAYHEREFIIDLEGAPNSERFVQDRIVTFGKDASDEFFNDITLPNMNQLDSIFAFIYINSKGFNLVDISLRGVVKMKVNDSPIKLVDGMFIIFGNNSLILVSISEDGLLRIGNQNIKMLTLTGFSASTKHIAYRTEIINQRVTIGRGPENQIKLNTDDISQQHAECYYDGENEDWKLRDLGSTNGTFYRLKTRDQTDKKLPSESILLGFYSVFSVEGFTFIVLPKE